MIKNLHNQVIDLDYTKLSIFFYDIESSSSKEQYAIRNLKEDQARFLWFYRCHNFMIKLENDDNKKAKQEIISSCRREYKDDRTKSAIDEFNKQSFDDNAKNAIWWY